MDSQTDSQATSLIDAQSNSSIGVQSTSETPLPVQPARSSEPTIQDVKGWNWGAFMFNIWWGIGNKTYLPLLCLIPFFNIIWIFVCGAKGNEWAWNDSDKRDLTTFKAIQKTWSRAGLILFIFTAAIFVLYAVLIGLFGLLIANNPDF